MPPLAQRIVDITRGLSLRARLYGVFIAMLGLVLLVGTVSVVSDYRMLGALESYLATDRRIAALSTRSAEAMLKARRHEKDFLLKVEEYGFRETRSRYATLLQSELERIRENMAAIRALRDDPGLAQETRRIETAVGHYEAGFLRVVDFHGQLARRDTGVVARLNSVGDELGTVAGKFASPRLENAVLRLRRDEKNDLVRGREQHLTRLAEAVGRINAEAGSGALPPATRQQLARLADDYLTLARQYALIEKQIEEEIETYLNAVRLIEPQLDQLYAEATDNAASTVETVRRLARTTLWTAVAACLGAILLGLVFASIVTRHIGRSVDAFMDAVERIGRGDFAILRAANGGREFSVLKAMAAALQQAQADLQAKLSELATANQTLQQRNQALAETQQQLQQAEKMAAIGQLAAGVAHEINNPIGYVHSNLATLDQYLQKLLAVVSAYEAVDGKLPLPPSQRGAIDQARTDADLDFLRSDAAQLIGESKEGIGRVIRIVRDLRDFSRVGELEQWKLADLHQGLDSTLHLLASELAPKALVVREYGTLPEVECLPSQLNQVFLHLLSNASAAIDRRGTITVRSGVAGEEVWVEIEDTGRGIPAADLPRIFDPFFTTRSVGDGVGLGLSLCYSIVRQHHGRIEVDSTLGQGSRFRVWLPHRQPDGAADTTAPERRDVGLALGI